MFQGHFENRPRGLRLFQWRFVMTCMGQANARHFCGQYRNLYHCRMKTILDLNDQLLADAKSLAA